jgi:hypothetical protein
MYIPRARRPGIALHHTAKEIAMFHGYGPAVTKRPFPESEC